MSVNTTLSDQHGHPRDKDIQFFEEGHVYNVRGDESFMSVTTLLGEYKNKFDAEQKIQDIANSSKVNDPGNKYFAMTAADIRESWDRTRNEASRLGTEMHYNVECFYNGNPMPNPDLPEIRTHFRRFNEEHVQPMGYIPYRTEWFVFDEDAHVAGAIDMVFQVSAEQPDDLLIYDWKRSKEICYNDQWGRKTMKPPLNGLQDCNYSHYCMQLNVYRYILEKYYGKRIVGMCLVVMHSDAPTYSLHPVRRLDRETHAVMQKRMDEWKASIELTV